MARPAPIHAPDPTFAGPFRYRLVDEHFLLTNLAGRYLFLTVEQFQQLAEGKVDPDSDLYRQLAEHGFIRTEVKLEALADQLGMRKRFLDYGPNLHVVEVTLRCNQTCLYCHSSRAPMDAADQDMTADTADQVLDRIFETTSPSVTIEFQGGEPLANFPVVRHIIEAALDRNRGMGKSLEFSLVSNLSLMDEDKLGYLIDRRVQICTSVDGPADLHDQQRRLAGGSALDQAVHWVRRINEVYAEAGLEPDVYHVEGLLTVTREALSRPREIVDTYRSLGFRALFLRPVDPFGFAARTRQQVWFAPSEFLEFYRRAVDYMIELNLEGVQILERYAAILLTKILQGVDPNFLDLRSPCGAGIGQVAYTHDGKVFTCDEARMLHHMGDDFFQIGTVSGSRYSDLMRHDTVKALLVASNLEASPDCADCVYHPFCGICPVYNYAMQGSIQGQLRTSPWCETLMGIQDFLFTKLRRADSSVREVFDRWTAVRPREHYLHLGGEAE